MDDIGYMNAKALRDAARDMLDITIGPLMEPPGDYCPAGDCTECAYQKGVEGAAKWLEDYATRMELIACGVLIEVETIAEQLPDNGGFLIHFPRQFAEVLPEVAEGVSQTAMVAMSMARKHSTPEREFSVTCVRMKWLPKEG